MNKRSFSLLIFAVLLAILCTLTSCSGEGTQHSSGMPGSLVSLPGGAWPQNRFTEGIPVPPGTVEYGLLDTEKEYCSVFLNGLTDEEYHTYMTRLKEAGFEVVEEVSEDIEGQDYVSIGTVLFSQENAISISYIPGRLGVYISFASADRQQ